MSDRNEFDELARRKLQERDFPFQEEHWSRLAEALDGTRPATTWWKRIWYVPLLLLLMGGAWWMLPGTDDGRGDEIARVEGDRSIGTSMRVATDSEMPEGAKRSPETSTENSEAGTSSSGSITTVARNVQDDGAKEVPVIGRSDVEERSDRIQEEAYRTFTHDNNASSRSANTSMASSENIITANEQQLESGDGSINDESTVHASMNIDLPSEKAITSSNVDRSGNVPNDEAVTPAAEHVDDETSLNAGVADPLPPVFVDNVYATHLLPLDLTRTEEPHGSPVPADFIHAPTFVDVRSPFEFTLFGGITYSTSSYTGTNTNDWHTSIGRQEEIGGGAELMRMGRNFGIGTGLHYTTFAEALTADEMRRTQWETRSFYFLTPLDTTILFITDSIDPNGIVHYIGGSVNTTVMVLDEGTETTSTEVLEREARSFINRTSYLEIPLLLDAHVTQGRWNIGLRGGPSIGILSGSRVTVPFGSDGYLDLNEENFRSTIIGYHARAYLRFRFNAGWSIGAEPLVRGLLMNTLGSEELVRKPRAFGGMLSLSYRFK